MKAPPKPGGTGEIGQRGVHLRAGPGVTTGWESRSTTAGLRPGGWGRLRRVVHSPHTVTFSFTTIHRLIHTVDNYSFVISRIPRRSTTVENPVDCAETPAKRTFVRIVEQVDAFPRPHPPLWKDALSSQLPQSPPHPVDNSAPHPVKRGYHRWCSNVDRLVATQPVPHRTPRRLARLRGVQRPRAHGDPRDAPEPRGTRAGPLRRRPGAGGGGGDRDRKESARWPCSHSTAS